MINSLDHLIIAVNDLDEAENNYKKLLFPFLQIDDFYVLNTFSPKKP